METISAFFMRNVVFVYFFYGLAFFALGLVVLLESGRASEFRFARALLPLALFSFLHGGHEWFEMFQIFAAHQAGYEAGVAEELIGVAALGLSFWLLLVFGTRLLPGAEAVPTASTWQALAMVGLWLASLGFFYLTKRPSFSDVLIAGDVLARYSLGIPGSLLAAWVLLRERRDFHARGMSAYGQDLLWAALAFAVYGVVGQLFTRPSLIFPSQTINTAFFLRVFGIPIQLLRGLMAIAIAVTLGRALRAFELESRLRLARANKARIEAQAAALEAQERRANEVEALNVQLQATAQELSALVGMARTLSSTMDPRRAMKDALIQVVHSFKCVCWSLIYLKRSDGELELASEYRRSDAPPAVRPPPLATVVSKVVASTQPVGEALDGAVQALSDESFAGGQKYRSLGVPLVAKGQILGGLALGWGQEEATLGEAELRLLTAFAGQIATSIENARLYQVVQERETQLEGLVRQLVNAQEGERARIARELHDETGQKLTALAMGLAAVEGSLAGEPARAHNLVRNLREVADQAITELRNIMANLRPAQLDDLGLVPALRWYIGQYGARHSELALCLNATRFARRLPPEQETVLFRVAQEALTNVVRHAHASQVSIDLSQEKDCARLVVTDNGVGFDVNTPPKYESGSGLGLVGMRERVALVGGRCSVESEPGCGTRITIELPVK